MDHATAIGSGAVVRLIDIDGDGVPSLVVGDFAAGAIYLLTSATADSLASPSWSVTGDPGLIAAAYDVGDDLDGDGNPDLVVGCSACDDGLVTQGMIAVHTVGTTGSETLGAGPMRMLGSERQHLGYPLAVADFDGDGAADLVSGLTGGSVRLWLGPLSGELDSSGYTAEANPTTSAALIEPTLYTDQDVTGDGVVDLVVGLPDEARTSYENGMVTVYEATTTGDLDFFFATDGASWPARFGSSVGGADGWLVVGASEAGTAILSTPLPSGRFDFADAISAGLAFEDTGASLSGPAAVGDFDADGDEDLIVLESSSTANRARFWTDW